jgi:Ni,Fe-hydrogenase I cytochrome b subunit
VLEPQLSWEYWVYALCAAVFPLAGYYLGYNAAAWLESREMVPLLVRIPAVVFVVEEEVERPKPVEVVARRRWREELVFPVEE